LSVRFDRRNVTLALAAQISVAEFPLHRSAWLRW